MSGSPRVSVIITTYNRAALLPRAVNSVLTQTYRDLELIIVDDCSMDHTSEVVTRFKDPRISVLRHSENRGQGAAFNTGLLHANGEYIAFLDDDDEWMLTKLEKQVALMEAASDRVGLVYCWTDRLNDETGEEVFSYRFQDTGDIFELLLAFQIPAPTSAWLVRRAAAMEAGGYDESVKGHTDLAFLASVASRFWAECVPEVLALTHIVHGQSRARSRTMAANRLRYVRKHAQIYGEQLRRLPRCRSAVLRRRAMLELQTGLRLHAMLSLLRAWGHDPIGTCWRILRYLIRRWAFGRR